MSHLRAVIVAVVLTALSNVPALGADEQAAPRNNDGQLLRRLLQDMAVRDYRFRGPGLPQGSYAMLLSSPAIIDELHVTTEQITRIKSAQKKNGPKARELFHKLQNAPRNGMDRNELTQALDEIQTTTDRDVMAVLSRGQRDRLQQISLQQQGPLILERPEFGPRLNMSPEQFELIHEIFAAHKAAQTQVESRRVRKPLPEQTDAKGLKEFWQSVSQFRTEDERAREATIRQVFKVIRPKQRETFAKLLGDPFDLKVLTWSGAATFEKKKQQAEAQKDSPSIISAGEKPKQAIGASNKPRD